MFKNIVNHYAIRRKNEKMTVVFFEYVILNTPEMALTIRPLPTNGFRTAFTRYL
jgi:hypothetical protein